MKRLKKYNKGDNINGSIFIKEVEPLIYENGIVVRKAMYKCECCGNSFIERIYWVNSKKILTICKSCKKKKRDIKNISNKKLFHVWQDIKTRCFNKNYKSYHRYGGRGITMCEEWKNSSRAFYEWGISNGWEDGLSIDRIDNDGDYEPNNCRFVTQQENAQNQERTVLNPELVLKIRKYIKNNPYKTQASISRKFKVSTSVIFLLKHNRIWKNYQIDKYQ